MEIIPAIDISGGKCVRLFKGQRGTEKIYYENPLNALDFWIKQGIPRIHFVDLDGAWGSDKNQVILKNMILKAKEVNLKIQIGGGIRTYEAAVELINMGVARVIIGTLAIQQPNVIKQLSEEFGAEHLIVALDYKGGKISTHGWTQQTDKDPFIYGKKIAELGAGYILFSSVEADGAFTGPDLKNIEKMVRSVDIPVYAAGGVRNEEDIMNLERIGTHGVIVGKAFYENKLPLSILKKSK